MDVTEATIALQTYAHWKAVTRQALEDIPQIQTIVQNRLLAGVSSALEAAAVAALVAAALPAVDGDGSLTSGIRVAIASVESAGYSPNAVLLNPADAATLDMDSYTQTNNGAVRNGSIWGLPMVPARSVAPGTAYAGDFKQGLTWFRPGHHGRLHVRFARRLLPPQPARGAGRGACRLRRHRAERAVRSDRWDRTRGRQARAGASSSA